MVWVLLAALPVLALIGTLYWEQGAEALEDPAPAESGDSGTVAFLMEQQWLIRMKLAQARLRDLAPQVRVVGRIVPAANHRAIVSSSVSGLIGEGGVPRLGQMVGRAEELITLRQIPSVAETAQVVGLRLEAGRTESERRGLEQSRAEAEIRLEEARRELDRAKRLYEAEVLAEQELDAAQTDFEAAETRVRSFAGQLEALVESPTPGGAAASTTLTHVLTGPIAGKVTEVYKTVGELVQPGEPILEIVNFDTVWVEAPVFREEIFRQFSRWGRRYSKPRLTPVSSSWDASWMSEPESTRKPGQQRSRSKSRTRTAAFESVCRRTCDSMPALRENLVVIPAEAVLEHDGQDIVYVLLSGEEFQRRNVVIEGRYGDEVAIVAGLEPGERVVTQGVYQLKLQELQPADPGEHTHEV